MQKLPVMADESRYTIDLKRIFLTLAGPTATASDVLHSKASTSPLTQVKQAQSAVSVGV